MTEGKIYFKLIRLIETNEDIEFKEKAIELIDKLISENQDMKLAISQFRNTLKNVEKINT